MELEGDKVDFLDEFLWTVSWQLIACFIKWFSWEAQASYGSTLELMFVWFLKKIQEIKSRIVQIPGVWDHKCVKTVQTFYHIYCFIFIISFN